MDPATNFGRAAADYARHRAGFPESFFDRLRASGVGAPGQRIVDLGTGTGTLARGFAAAGARVTGIDPDARMLDAARGIASGLDVDWRVGTAESTGLADGCADVVTAGQCWHWFDGPAAAREVWRILRPGGRVVVASMDWIPLPGNLVAKTEAVLLAHNPGWAGAGGTGLHPERLPVLGAQGFDTLETFSFDEDLAYTTDGWRGRVRASAAVGASLEPEAVARVDRALADLLAVEAPSGRVEVPHRVWAVVGRRPR